MNTIIPGHMGYIHQQEILEQAAKIRDRKSVRDVVATLSNRFIGTDQKLADTTCSDCCLQTASTSTV